MHQGHTHDSGIHQSFALEADQEECQIIIPGSGGCGIAMK